MIYEHLNTLFGGVLINMGTGPRNNLFSTDMVLVLLLNLVINQKMFSGSQVKFSATTPLPRLNKIILFALQSMKPSTMETRRAVMQHV